MKEKLLLCMSVLLALNAYGTGKGGSVTSDPSPLVSTQGGTLVIDVSGSDLSGDLYLYSWAVVGGKEVPATTWDGSITNKYKLTASHAKYTYNIENLQRFFGLTDDQLPQFTRVGVIARNASGGQTVDLFLEVSQAPKVYYSGGEGTAASPYLLSNEQDLLALADKSEDWSKAFKLSASIALSGAFTGIGSKGTPFSGTFDGAGYSIQRLQIIGSDDATGLFPYIDHATIRFVGVTDVNVSGQTFVGALVGVALSGTVERCYVSGTVTGRGICVGGMVGGNEGATFQNCYSTCTVTNINDPATGGFAGKNQGTIQNAYATGSVNGRAYLGGFVGANYGAIANCAAINNPLQSSQAFVARFGGNNNQLNSSDRNISWEGMQLNKAYLWADDGDHATPKKTADLKLQTCFTSDLGWDFSSIWEWDPVNYPKLARMAGQIPTYPTDFPETGIETILSDGMTIYPNPMVDVVQIRSERAMDLVQWFDLTGKLVKEEVVSGHDACLNVSNFSAGLYLLNIYAGSDVLYRGKTIKK